MGNRVSLPLFAAAKEYAFLLLKFRMRSEKEIRQRLERKKFSEDIIGRIIDFLNEKKFINDIEFARAWTEERIKKPYGLRRITQELRQKGIAPEIIKDQIQQISKTYSEEAAAVNIARERFVKTNKADPQKIKKKIFDYLIRRGFGFDTALQATENLKGRD